VSQTALGKCLFNLALKSPSSAALDARVMQLESDFSLPVRLYLTLAQIVKGNNNGYQSMKAMISLQHESFPRLFG
jgi:hypothetical protein